MTIIIQSRTVDGDEPGPWLPESRDHATEASAITLARELSFEPVESDATERNYRVVVVHSGIIKVIWPR
jgi:hypothetical protein